MDIKNHQFITFFESDQADALCNLAEIKEFANESVIFEEGQIPDYLYLVLEGQVLFRKQTEQNHYQVVAQANPNEFFGEFGILDGQPRSAQAIVHERAILAKIPRNILMEILNDTKSAVVLKLFHYVIQRLRTTTEEFVKQVAYKDKMVLVGEMVNTIIHDLKSPLSGIHLSSGMIKELHEDDEETLEWCDLIQEQAIRMTAMAEELLQFARGNGNLDKREMNLDRALKRFEKLNHIYFKQAGIELSIECPDNFLIHADENKLLRVVQNLVVNAVEAFDGKPGKVEVTAEKSPNSVDIQVRDNGPGIPEEIRETFFDSFVTYGKKSGTGLGTAIAKSIIDAHQGQINFISTLGKGTTFFIKLPL